LRDETIASSDNEKIPLMTINTSATPSSNMAPDRAFRRGAQAIGSGDQSSAALRRSIGFGEDDRLGQLENEESR
jgi:hypothetical protein